MSTVGMSESLAARWTGRTVEGALGGLTLLLGVGIAVWLGFGPSTCEPGGSPCYGLLGPTPARWFDLTSFAFVWIPLVCAAVLGIGAIQNVRGSGARISGLRWAAALMLELLTLLLLVASPIGYLMIPVSLIAYLTAGVGQVRAQRGEATASLAGPVLGGLATVAFVAVAFLTVQNLLLILR